MNVFDNLLDLSVRAKRKLTRILLQELGERTASRWIIVFQMGKVGSQSVVTSLKKRLGLTPVFHLHVLSEKQVSRMQSLIEHGVETRRHRDLVEYAVKMRQKLTNRSGARKKIVSLVRDPVAQMIASTMSEYVENNPKAFEHSTHISPENMVMLQQFFSKRLDYEYNFIAPWFDTEIRDLYGIDVLAVPFPVEQGYAIYKADNADLLLMRLENLKQCHREAIAKFLDLTDFELVSTNRAEDKGSTYSNAYLEFKKNVVLSNKLLDKLYSIPWVRHFYSEHEIALFRLEWENHKNNAKPSY